MNKNIRFISLILLVVFYLFTFSCEEGAFELNVNCDECYSEKPDSADLIVHLSFSEVNDSIPLAFYRGKVEEGQLEWLDTAYVKDYPEGRYYLYSPVSEYYSIKATYKTAANKTIIAVDGDKLTVKHITDVCDTDCWIIKGGILDVRLKYE
jgi:hypothetical protein